MSEGEKATSGLHPTGKWISRMRLLGQPKLVTGAGYEGPNAAVSLVVKSYTRSRLREKSGITRSNCGLIITHKIDFDKPSKECLTIKPSRTAFAAASVH